MAVRSASRARLPGVFVLAALAGTAGCAPKVVPAYHPGPRETGPAAQVSLQLAGTGSCSARGCHGGSEPVEGTVLRTEYTSWVLRDPHARAYQVLTTDVSKRIVALLQASWPAGRERPPAERWDVCLACHTNPASTGAAAHQFVKDSPDTEEARLVREDQTIGVGCESCHGSARRWLGPHYQPGFRNKTPQEKAKLGLVVTSDPVQVAKVCAGCHVGAPPGEGIARDMNHDLIAAGHPRLYFDYATFYANLPPHWKQLRTPQQEAEEEAKRWAVGQIAAAQQAMELLAYRAADAPVWPEFAESDCYACHHDLKAESWRQAHGYLGRKPGDPPQSRWYTSLLGVALGGEPDLAAVQAATKGWCPKRADVVGPAKECAADLGGRLQAMTVPSSAELRDRLKAVLKDEARAPRDWDEGAQLYLALVAANRLKTDKELAGSADKLLKELRESFRQKADAPALPRFDSPIDFSPRALRDAIRRP